MNPWAAATLGYLFGMAVGVYIVHKRFLDRFGGAFRARIQHHDVADAFWASWRINGETGKHGYYEATWMAIHAALDAAREEKS